MGPLQVYSFSGASRKEMLRHIMSVRRFFLYYKISCHSWILKRTATYI